MGVIEARLRVFYSLYSKVHICYLMHSVVKSYHVTAAEKSVTSYD